MQCFRGEASRCMIGLTADLLLSNLTKVRSILPYLIPSDDSDQCSSRKVTTVSRKPNRMLPKALDLLHFEPEFHRMQ